MDVFANKMRTDTHISLPMRRVYAHTAIGIYSDNKLITNLNEYFYSSVNGQNNIEQLLVNGKAVKEAMKKHTEYKKQK